MCPRRVAPDRKAQAHQEHYRSAGQKNTEGDVDDVLHQGEKAQAIHSRVVVWEEPAFPDAAMVTPSAKRGVLRFRIRRSNPAASGRVAGRDWNQRYRSSSSRYTGLKVAFESLCTAMSSGPLVPVSF